MAARAPRLRSLRESVRLGAGRLLPRHRPRSRLRRPISHEYPVRGGFPQTAQVDSVTQAQRLLREDHRQGAQARHDRPVRRAPRPRPGAHLPTSMHDGGLPQGSTCAATKVKRPTAQNFIGTAGSHASIYRLAPMATARTSLRARFKICGGCRHRTGRHAQGQEPFWKDAVRWAGGHRRPCSRPVRSLPPAERPFVLAREANTR